MKASLSEKIFYHIKINPSYSYEIKEEESSYTVKNKDENQLIVSLNNNSFFQVKLID